MGFLRFFWVKKQTSKRLYLWVVVLLLENIFAIRKDRLPRGCSSARLENKPDLNCLIDARRGHEDHDDDESDC